MNRAAAAFIGLGLRPTDRVIFQLINCKELVIAFLGCLRAGLIPVCTLAAHREHEIGYIANHAEARAHIVQGDDPKFDHVAFADELRGSVPSMKVLISARGAARPGIARLEDLIERTQPAQAAALVATMRHDPYQVALMQLSGGTSGVPKLIPRFNSEYVYNMRAVAGFLEYRADDVMLMPMPMIHNASMCCAWGPMLLVGGTFIITPAVGRSSGGRAEEASADVARRRAPRAAASDRRRHRIVRRANQPGARCLGDQLGLIRPRRNESAPAITSSAWGRA